MKHNSLFYILLSTLIVLTACSAPATAESTPLPPPTTAPEPTPVHPTEPPEPTTEPSPEPAPIIEPTATPENQLFRDDFTGELQPGWTWENENPDLFGRLLMMDGSKSWVKIAPSLTSNHNRTCCGATCRAGISSLPSI